MERDESAGGRGAVLWLAWVQLALAAGVLASFWPPCGPISGAPEDVSPARALAHLEVIAAEPRPAGSPRNALVREHLVRSIEALGLPAEVHEHEVDGTPVRNVVARLPGTEGGPALLVACHYDSRPETPGAGDDGSACAALLEALRALSVSPPLARDVVFLFSDGEEDGLLGARAFAERLDRGQERVGAVLNFDAIGNAGPPVLFETGPGSGALVRAFAESAPCPVGSSLGPAVYARMPNDTDFSPFRDRGIAGLNFALCFGSTAYHRPADTVAHLSRASLAHQGATALALARRLAAGELPPPPEPDRVFFDVAGPHVVLFAEARALPLALALAAAAALDLVRRARSGALGRASLARALAAGAALAGGLACAVVLLRGLDGAGAGLARFAGLGGPERGNAVSGTLGYLAAATGVPVVLAAAVGRVRPDAGAALAAVARAGLALVGLWLSRNLAGASHVFLLPLAGSLLSGLLGAAPGAAGAAVRALAPLPAALVVVPSLHIVHMLFSRAPLPAAVLAVLGAALLLLPLAQDLARAGRVGPSPLAASASLPLLLGLAAGWTRGMGL